MAGMNDYQYDMIDDRDNWNRPIAWAVLFVTLSFNFVLMFNLLLSVINETYGKVNDKHVEYQFKEWAEAIAAIQRIVPKWFINNNAPSMEDTTKLLLIANNIGENDVPTEKELI